MKQSPSDTRVFFRLLILFKPYWGWMALGIILSLITLLTNVGLLALSGWFISIMAIAGVAGVTDINYFTPSASIRALAIARTAGRYIERVVSHEATFRLLAELRQWFYNRLEPLAPAVLARYQSGDILSRISADINTLENFYIRILSPIIVAIISLILYALFLAQYDEHLLMAEIGLLLLAGLIIPILINRLAKPSGERLNQTASQLRQAAIDTTQGMGELLIYGAATAQKEKTKDLSKALIKDQQTQAILSGFSQGFVGFCTHIALWLVLVISIPLITNGTLETAQLAMLALFALASFEVIAPLPLVLQLLPTTLSAARRLFEISDATPMINEPSQPSPMPKHYDIEFKTVSFQYKKDNPVALDSLSFHLKTGKHLAIMGKSGSGKSTIIQLLSRFWPLDETHQGRILFGGYPIECYQSDDLRQYFSVLSQHNHLFNNTIRNNLLLANPAASEEMLDDVCKVAQIDTFIAAQPHGYDTWVGEAGLQLSGGQARRIAIARTLLKDTPILILDEPSEGLDAKTEEALIKAIIQYRSQASLLLITHKKVGLTQIDDHLSL